MTVGSILKTFCLALLPALVSAQAARITRLAYGNPSAPGWSVDPGIGTLNFSIPFGQVAGELPIPVTFAMNGTFMSSVATPNSSAYLNYGAYGTLNFGSIGYDQLTAAQDVVLEDGRCYAWTDFAAFPSPSPYSSYGTSLPAAYKITNTPAQFTWFKINSEASLVWANIPAATFAASFASQLTSHLPVGGPAVTTYDLLIDKNRLRVFAEVGTGSSMVAYPIYWADRFGHFVTFQWTTSTTSLPAGISSIVRVDALNQRGKGVSVRYAVGTDTTTAIDLLRADFVGCEGPSVRMSGYSGKSNNAPAGFSIVGATGALTFGGMVARPLVIVMGDPHDTTNLVEPTWNNSGSTAAANPIATIPFANTGSAAMTWNLGYDANLTMLTDIQNPTKVQTHFSYLLYALLGSMGSSNTFIWGVKQVGETDASGTST